MRFEFQTLGIDYPSYFPGVGVSGTEWDAVYVGIGRSEREAADDAVDQFAMAVDYEPVLAEIEAEVLTFSNDESDIEDEERAMAIENGVDPDDDIKRIARAEELPQVYVALFVTEGDK